MAKKKHILITVLHWGLGHAVRCIPIIKHFSDLSCKVSIASDGQGLYFLKGQFPELDYFELPSYQISYPTRNIYLNLAIKSPSILLAITKEHKAIKKLHAAHQFDAIVSDNRYGCYHKSVPSILITHQVNLIGNNLSIQKTGSLMHHGLIKQFDFVWVPDVKKAPGLTADMGHGNFNFPIQYLGLLSDLKKNVEPENSKRALIIVLSGPEPQRTKLENLLLTELQYFEEDVLLVRGLVGETKELSHDHPRLKVVNFLNRSNIQKELNASKVLLCRSGYTSLMDLAKIKMPAILIPTPGQPEQEYLSKKLSDQGIFFHIHQDQLNLSLAYRECLKTKKIDFSSAETDSYKKLISDFVTQL